MIRTCITGIIIMLVCIACQSNATTNKPQAASEAATDTQSSKTAPYVLPKHLGKGSLSFKANGTLYQADPAHAKAFSNAQMPAAMIMARNDNGLTVSVQFGYTKEGAYKIDRDGKGTVGFTINNAMYWVRMPSNGEYLTINITKAQTIGNVILLSGTFEGVLEDKDGNKITITDGQFTTDNL